MQLFAIIYNNITQEYIMEFDISILDQIKNKPGEYYDMLEEDDFNFNLNLESCMNIPDKKQKKKQQ